MSSQTLSIRIALRYLFSRKSHAAVNVLSYISMAGVAIAATAMVIVLSVFNGFFEFTADKLSYFNAPLVVSPATDKVINNADSLAAALASIEGVEQATPTITERAFAVADNHQLPIILYGIDPTGVSAGMLPNVIIDGASSLIYDSSEGLPNTAISSVGVANSLRAFPSAPVDIKIYEPRRNARVNPANPLAAFRCDTIVITGVYRVDQNELDNDYLFVPIQFARKLLGYTTEASAIEISATEGTNISSLQQDIERFTGDSFIVADRLEQQQDSFRMINVEKWITLFMLTFILIVATFNVLAIMSIMIIEKRSNSAILTSLGATSSSISSIYGWLSMFITSIGGFIGIIIGLALSLLQQYCGFIKLYADDPTQLSIEAYPVSVAITDVMIVLAVVAGIGFLTTLITRYIIAYKSSR